ncbi:hypothetical protein GYMLUDRAFT_448059 [Collybiopsis luxurians FD-317 M1]|uniref:Uncharacterized protein n=1 Tax=Collybiopsis luxurians FD-317 M1 TaxID=944289 RepID=A0A0D0CVH6_9AGAR|nr:hypothetical protein GYMLUDRAFT_448059 [Collybiopsis luxurians FD-317 M1]
MCVDTLLPAPSSFIPLQLSPFFSGSDAVPCCILSILFLSCLAMSPHLSFEYRCIVFYQSGTLASKLHTLCIAVPFFSPYTCRHTSLSVCVYSLSYLQYLTYGIDILCSPWKYAHSFQTSFASWYNCVCICGFCKGSRRSTLGTRRILNAFKYLKRLPRYTYSN